VTFSVIGWKFLPKPGVVVKTVVIIILTAMGVQAQALTLTDRQAIIKNFIEEAPAMSAIDFSPCKLQPDLKAGKILASGPAGAKVEFDLHTADDLVLQEWNQNRIYVSYSKTPPANPEVPWKDRVYIRDIGFSQYELTADQNYHRTPIVCRGIIRPR
jgi:hypothetical protein